ncbi:methyltransferase family protein [Limobrevibacterium gyesilva]|uniref:Isoprenylcysteine carboxylmethyltransferase family protein n=1 Tax=Limobrevibacterium gyesilva TaxID=2991712 RepID=A0AA42CH66_9PROT|nr:isoprenylcysteine carboxylmethyltransferase family protein [Limobrevibacterium gyesilva]MCW3476911.1 isoprenylcysteine carboxylmethyltransferase family protein [Limobrevibacterium gyesilva]
MVTRLFVQTVLWLAVMAVLLFLPAGRVDWPGAWLFLAETGVLSIVVGLWLAMHDPALLAERLASPVQRAQKGWDKVFMAGVTALFCFWLVLMALDAARYRWSAVSPWVQGVGAALIFISIAVVSLVFQANSYAAPVVKIQAARGQTVISSGPYRYVRHPMYAGAILFFLGTPLLLGSWYGLALVPALIALIALRAVLEERMLSAELEGYAAYAARVRYRLIPLIW